MAQRVADDADHPMLASQRFSYEGASGSAARAEHDDLP